MPFPLGKKLPRWKISRSSIKAKKQAAEEERKKAEQGDEKAFSIQDSVQLHDPDSVLIEDHFDSDSEYFSCEEHPRKDVETKEDGKTDAGLAVAKE